MSDEMDVLFDHRLRNALHGTSLPPAPASLRDALEDLPRTAGGTTARSVPRWTAGAALAAGLAAVAVLGGAAIFGLGGLGPAGNPTPPPSPSASASASPSPTPSPSSETFDVLSPAQILEDGRTAPSAANGSTSGATTAARYLFPTTLPQDPARQRDRRERCADRFLRPRRRMDAQPGSRGGRPCVLPAGYPARRSRGHRPALARPAGSSHAAQTDLVIVNGHFLEPRTLECPYVAAPPCIDRFDVVDVISFDDPYERASASPEASATPFPFDSPPPPPSSMANCSQPRAATGPEPGDPSISDMREKAGSRGPSFPSSSWAASCCRRSCTTPRSTRISRSARGRSP